MRNLIMSKRSNFTSFIVVTIYTIPTFASLFSTGRSKGFYPISKVVTCSIGITIYVTMATMASVGCITLFGTGGGGYNGGVQQNTLQ